MNFSTTILRKPTIVLRILVLIILFLSLAHGVMQSRDYRGYEDVYGLLPLFDLDTENNIPSLYATVTLLISSILLGLIGIKTFKQKESYTYHWFGLAGVFLYLAIDELEKIHERLSEPVAALLPVARQFNSAWVIPFGLVLIILLILYSRFILSLPKNIRDLFLLAGFIFVTGAMGLEILGVSRGSIYGGDVITIFIYSLEEIFEMVGIAIFIYALLKCYASLVRGVKET
jgi:hypothetical protein